MAIKYEIDKEYDSDKYPFIGLFEEQNLVIIFTELCTGVVINKGSSSHAVGHKDNNWIEHCFKKIKSITLTNE